MEQPASLKPWHVGYWGTAWAAAPLRDRRWFAGLLLLHLLLSAWFTTQQSPNYDESDYYGYALRWAKGQSERIYPLDDSKTPLTFVALLPLVAKPFTKLPPDTDVWLLSGRYCMYVYVVLLAFVAFCWLNRLLGAGKWILPWLLLLYDPLMFSYGMVVGSDLPSAAVLLALMYMGWRYSRTGHMRYWWMMSVLHNRLIDNRNWKTTRLCRKTGIAPSPTPRPLLSAWMGVYEAISHPG